MVRQESEGGIDRMMAEKKVVEVRVVEEGTERILLRKFSDGTIERMPIVKLPRKERRPGPARSRDMNRGRKKIF
jgi:hypothetical protein